MRVTFNLQSYGVRQIEATSSISKLIDDGKIRLVLGEEAERIENQFIIDFDSGTKDTFEVLLNSEGHGLTPMILALPSIETILIGYNSHVAEISVKDKNVEKIMSLGSLFYSFFHLPKDNRILILCELGVIAISESGDILWRFDGDVIENYEIENEIMVLKCMDDSIVKISIIDGSLI